MTSHSYSSRVFWNEKSFFCGWFFCSVLDRAFCNKDINPKTAPKNGFCIVSRFCMLSMASRSSLKLREFFGTKSRFSAADFSAAFWTPPSAIGKSAQKCAKKMLSMTPTLILCGCESFEGNKFSGAKNRFFAPYFSAAFWTRLLQ